ncbi:MAG TPA: hypothetical protein ENJ10_06570 [Caldithrix abyssi]|uniref:Translation initiation factor eIF-2B n=1 Tax=Caldithrix abyssi TaxID=187145 RepID=A0A7V1LZ85_CALAY|nr:hypothetical protein [Caldithrix abyssi]
MTIDISPILADKTSGSFTYTLNILKRISAFIEEHGSSLSREELFEEVHQAGRRLIKVQPNMVLVRRYNNQLISYYKRVLKAGKSDDEIRQALVEKIAELLEEMEASLKVIAHSGTKVITNFNKIMTISNSTTVRRILDEAIRQKRKFEVYVAASRPPGEGLHLAEYLAGKGVKVTVVADSQIGVVMNEMNLVLVGADRIYEEGFVNKAGTLPVSLVAEQYHVPVYLAAETTKVLKESERTIKNIEEAAAEVYSPKNSDIHVINYYYEKIPFTAIRKVICEEGVFEVQEFQSWYLGD